MSAAGSITRKAARNASFERLFAFQCKARKLPEPSEQYLFAAELGRKFRADFAWPQYRLLVEIYGGLWKRGGGGHSHPMHIEKDIERAQYAALLGWTLLPVTTDQVTSGYAIALVLRVISEKEKKTWHGES